MTLQEEISISDLSPTVGARLKAEGGEPKAIASNSEVAGGWCPRSSVEPANKFLRGVSARDRQGRAVRVKAHIRGVILRRILMPVNAVVAQGC